MNTINLGILAFGILAVISLITISLSYTGVGDGIQIHEGLLLFALVSSLTMGMILVLYEEAEKKKEREREKNYND